MHETCELLAKYRVTSPTYVMNITENMTTSLGKCVFS